MKVDVPSGLLTSARLAAHNGEQVWVEVSPADRAEIIAKLPKGWSAVVLRRETGDYSVDELWRRFGSKLTLDEFRLALAKAYTLVDRKLQELAERRAALLP
jgi:hypothetical protein